MVALDIIGESLRITGVGRLELIVDLGEITGSENNLISISR